MASDIKKKTQEGVDSLFELVDGCQLVMLIDPETGLVLSTNTDAKVSQDERDRLASRACNALDFGPASTLCNEGSGSDIVSVTLMEATGNVIAIRDLSADGVAIVGRFNGTPSRSDLNQTAGDVLQLFAPEEAA